MNYFQKEKSSESPIDVCLRLVFPYHSAVHRVPPKTIPRGKEQPCKFIGKTLALMDLFRTLPEPEPYRFPMLTSVPTGKASKKYTQ